MKDRTPQWIAAAAGAGLVRWPASAPDPVAPGPARATVDSRSAGPGDLFVGVPGSRVDGGGFAAQALAAGAWGVLVSSPHADAAASAVGDGPGVVLSADDPLAALQTLATAWRRDLGCIVVGITGSTGKTSTKDLLRAMIAPQRPVVATRENLNTEIGLPLTVLEAPPGTEVLVLEMAMRGAGQIAELARIAEPDVALVTNIGPVHLELLGSLDAIVAAKAELLEGLRPGGTAVVPADEPRLAPYLRDDLVVVRVGEGGDVTDLGDVEPVSGGAPLDSAHMRRNALMALAAARAAGVEPHGRVDVALSALRGQRTRLAGGVVVVDDCYNANPMSMRAALDDLATTAHCRRVAVLGDMRELGPDERRFHAELGVAVRDAGVDVLVAVGSLGAHIAAGSGMGSVHSVPDAAAAAELVPRIVEDGDTVLVKASRGVGLEVVGAALAAARPPEPATGPPPPARG